VVVRQVVVTTVSADRLAKIIGARGSTGEREGRRNAQGQGPHGSLAASESFEALNQVDPVIICAPTPLAGDRPDMSHRHGVGRFILSSTANLFDRPERIPIAADEQIVPGSP
jgi:UDP-N-acetyl-D-mannosaminuronate dehydrogenase